MSEPNGRLLKKLTRVAEIVDKQKPQLRFFGLVHRTDGPPDRWDLLVSSDKLAPWSFEAIKYVAELLKKELTDEEMILLAQIVALPPDNALIVHLSQSLELPPSRFRDLPRAMDRIDRAVVIWPAVNSLRPAKSA